VQEISGHGEAVGKEAGRSLRELEQTGGPGKCSVSWVLIGCCFLLPTWDRHVIVNHSCITIVYVFLCSKWEPFRIWTIVYVDSISTSIRCMIFNRLLCTISTLLPLLLPRCRKLKLEDAYQHHRFLTDAREHVCLFSLSNCSDQCFQVVV